MSRAVFRRPFAPIVCAALPAAAMILATTVATSAAMDAGDPTRRAAVGLAPAASSAPFERARLAPLGPQAETPKADRASARGGLLDLVPHFVVPPADCDPVDIRLTEAVRCGADVYELAEVDGEAVYLLVSLE